MSILGDAVGGALLGGPIGGQIGGVLGSVGLGGVGNSLFGTQQGTVPYTNTNTPWKPLQPYMLQGYQGAQNLYDRGPYSGPYLASQSPYTVQAQQMEVQRAQDPNSLVGRSQSVLADTISGKYLDPSTNPYLQKSVQDALGLAGASFASQYGGNAGTNLSNSGYQEALARGLGATATNAYGQAYSQERQNQLNAINSAPTMDYAQAAMLGDVGAQQEARGQAEIGAAQQAYNSPWNNLGMYQASLQNGLGFGTTYGQQPFYSNNTATTLGALAGAGALFAGRRG